MDVQLRVAGSHDLHHELVSLRDWTSRESLLRGHVRAEHQPIRTGEMGGLEEVLIVALGSGGAATVLARSIAVWLQQRRSELRVEVTAPDGTRVEITGAGPAADQIAKIFEAHNPDKESSNAVAGRPSFPGGPDRHEQLR
ncbi:MULTISPECIES: effector-associated constant component EACC1 [Nocardia]|uniref:effector-associated constant component EACC1 n=1 Tax=Nocardia TaxID=1817 RepID=UPI0024589179|nr:MULTISPECIES: hypothetical protein [Nocardia]